MLRQHLHGLVFGDPVVEGVAQASQEHGKLSRCRTAVQNKLTHALDVAFGDVADVLGPVFPIHLVAAFLHDYGVHGLLQLSIGEIHFHLTGIAGRALLPVFARVSARTRTAILSFALILIDVDNLNNGSGRHVVLQRVDAALQPLVMASQGLHYLPHDFEGVCCPAPLRACSRRE